MVTSEVKCFFLVSVAGEKPQRITFQLATRIAPKTCQNFISFCRGADSGAEIDENATADAGKAKSYKGTQFHRIIKGFMAQGGDYERGDGSGGEAYTGGTLHDESYEMKHDGPGILSMANRGKNTAGSQFFITLGNASHLNGKHVAFGKVVDGMDVVRKMEECETDNKDKPVPMQRIVIVDCGVVGDRNDGNGNGYESDESSSSYLSRKEGGRKSSSKKRSKKKSRKRERKSSRSRDSKRRDRDYDSSDSETDEDSESHNDRRSRREKKHRREKKRRRRDDDKRRRSSESGGDDNEDDDDGGVIDRRSRDRDRHRKSKSSRKDKKRSRDRDRSRRRRYSSEDDTSSSDDSDSRRRSSPKRNKKSKRDKKDSKKRRKEDKKDRDRDSHKNKRSVKSSSASAAEVSFGKYGIIRDSDLFSSAKVKRTFEIWLEEVKGIPQGSNMAKWEVSDYFKTFAEDFNTCTMPHMKYYDYEKWEMEEYAKKKKEALEEKGGGIGDEFEYQEEQKRKIEMKKRKEMEITRLMMSKEKIEDMKRQALLKTEMVNAYRVGDEKTRMRLQKKLEPEEK